MYDVSQAQSPRVTNHQSLIINRPSHIVHRTSSIVHQIAHSKMIKKEEFLTPLMSMQPEEMSSYLHSLDSWLSDKLPQIQAKSEWTDADCAIFDEGLVFVSAFLRARDFCLAAYKFSTIDKRIKNFLYYIDQIKTFLQGHNILSSTPAHGSVSASERTSVTGSAPAPGSFASGSSALALKGSILGASFIPPIRTGKTGRPTKPRNIPEIASAGAQDILLRPINSDDPLRQPLDTRPRHLHEYIHLLPEDLQQEAMTIRSLYDALSDEAYKVESLVNDPRSTQKDRAFHAAKLCNIDDKIRNLWARIDAAYAEATGDTVSQDYKLFLETENHRINSETKEKDPCEYTKFDIDHMPEGEERDRIKAARIERNKKFLRKTDRQSSDQHRQNLIDAATELHAWGIAITDSQVECCRSYGYEVPQDWIELPLAERKRLQADARNAKRREERARIRAEKKAAKQAKINELKETYTKGDLSIFN